MTRPKKAQAADIVFDKDGKILSTQPNQITDLHMAPTLYSERAMDELVWSLQPFYAAAKRRENNPGGVMNTDKAKAATQLMLPFNSEDAYLVTSERVNDVQQEGDFVATIRFRDLPGITPKHYGEVRQMLKEMVKTVAEVRTEDGVLTTNFFDVIEEYETREIIDPKTGEHRTVRTNSLKRNEVKIRIRREILQHNFFLTESGYTQFYFPTTRHTKTATANRLYKWLSKWHGIKKNEMVEVVETLPDGTERTVGRIVFAADYMEVRSVCGLFNSKDGKIVNGEDVEALAIKTAKADGVAWDKATKAEQRMYVERARQRASEKYAYYSEFAKRYLAQAKKELDDLSSPERGLAAFTFDYRAIFADGRAKGKVPVKVEFTLTVFDLGRELYADMEAAAKEIEARTLMITDLGLTAKQANQFVNRLQPGDHDHLLIKLRELILSKPASFTKSLQDWSLSCLNNFFAKELPAQRGFTPAEEIPSPTSPESAAPGSVPNGFPVREETLSTDCFGWRIDAGITAAERNTLAMLIADLCSHATRHTEDTDGIRRMTDGLSLQAIHDGKHCIVLQLNGAALNREHAVSYYWAPGDFDSIVAAHFNGYRWTGKY